MTSSSRRRCFLTVLTIWSVTALVAMVRLHYGLSASHDPSQLYTMRRSARGGSNQAATEISISSTSPPRTPSPELQRKLREWQRVHMANDWVVMALVPITSSRGIVLPLFDKIAALGVTLLLQLQALGVDLPVEVPHCGDLSDDWRAVLETGNVTNAGNTTLTTGLRLQVRVYDVCATAAELRYSISPFLGSLARSPMFCESMEHCHHRFRSFDIKILSLLLSQFDEIMLVDADTLFFSSPMALWSTRKYQETGTLFFHDRVSFERGFLDQPWFPPIEGSIDTSSDSSGSQGSQHSSNATISFPPDYSTDGSDASGAKEDVPVVAHSNASVLQMYLHDADVAPFRHLSNVPRAPVSSQVTAQLNVSLPFQPSHFLLQSHSWNRRAGHQLDSSLLLWHKSRQARATAILASFLALSSGEFKRPPSYGDKELYFVACELAETAYAFSDFAVGAVGYNRAVNGSMPTFCGDTLHYFPESGSEEQAASNPPAPLYTNGDRIVLWRIHSNSSHTATTRETAASNEKTTMWRSVGRRAELYLGSFSAHNLPHECPLNATVVALRNDEVEQFAQRQQLHAALVQAMPVRRTSSSSSSSSSGSGSSNTSDEAGVGSTVP